MSRYGVTRAQCVLRLATAALVAVVAAGCGTRVTDRGAQPASAAPGTAEPGSITPVETSEASAVGDVAGDATSATPASAPVRTSPGSGGSGSTVAGRSGVSDGSTKAAAPGKASTPAAAQPSGRAPGSGASGSAPVTPGPGPALPAPPARSGARSAILLGNVSTTSGPAGSVGVQMLQGAQIWTRWINERGGLAGHPVKIFAADDGLDPARHRQAVQDLVENKKVIAFFNNFEALTGESSLEYLTTKRIPLVGMSGGEFWAYSSAMYFPQSSAGPATEDSLIAGTAQLMVARGKKKLGIVYCTEASSCSNYGAKAKQAERFGMQVVYRAQASLAQPDFTAECLSASRAGVEALFIVMDPNSIRRIAASCARQGLDFHYATGSQVTDDAMKDDPNLNERLVTAANTFPYMQSNTPGTAEFQQAVKAFGSGVKIGGMTSAAWVSGKLLERAVTAMPEPPTTEALLAGLWRIQNDDLGGLTQPISFRKDQPAAVLVCWFNLAIRNRTWDTTDNYQRHCL